MIAVRYEGGKLVEVLDCKDASIAQVDTLIQEAERNRKTLENAALRREKETLDKIAERDKERAVQAYYEPSRAVALINLMLHEYQDGKVEREEKDEALAFLSEIRGGKTVKDALGRHLAIKVEYEALYGRID